MKASPTLVGLLTTNLLIGSSKILLQKWVGGCGCPKWPCPFGFPVKPTQKRSP